MEEGVWYVCEMFAVLSVWDIFSLSSRSCMKIGACRNIFRFYFSFRG